MIFWYEFRLGSVSKYFTKVKQREIYLSSNVHDFLLDHSSAEKEDTCNLHEYLLVKNNIK